MFLGVDGLALGTEGEGALFLIVYKLRLGQKRVMVRSGWKWHLWVIFII